MSRLRETLRKLVAVVPRRQRRRWLVLVPLLVATGVVETAATGLVFLLIKIAGDPTYALRTPPLGAIYHALGIRTDFAIVLGFGLFLALFFVLRSLLLIAITWLHARAVADTTIAISGGLLDRYLGGPFAAHLGRSPSDLAFNATVAVDHAVTSGLGAVVVVATELLVSAGLIVFLLLAAPAITLATATVLGLLVAAVLRLTGRTSHRWGAARHELGQQANKAVNQALGGLREIKILGRERVFLDEIVRLRGELARLQRRHALVIGAPRLAIETIFVLGVVLVVVLATAGGREGARLIPLLGVYAYAGFRLIPSANRLLLGVDMVRSATRATDRLHADLGAFGPRDAIGPRDVGSPPAPIPPLSFAESIVLERVAFGYPGGPGLVLEDIDLTIPRGSSIGIVGATGAGKSTLIDLVLGLLDPTGGRITVDGVDIRGARRAWQRRIGYVPQAAFLFDDTIRRNVALGLAPGEIDEGRVVEAVRLARLDELVASLPAGLDTVVGERGVRLSGGQRQRVSIARALYHDPDVLVFDEATAALDNQTEREVARAIESLQGRRTLLIIAHRLSTVRRCDRLVLLRGGRVAATGTYDALLATDAGFRALAATDPDPDPDPAAATPQATP